MPSSPSTGCRVPTSGPTPAARVDVVVREARPDDLDAVVAANVAVQAYDAALGSLPDRPDSERVIRPGVEKALRERPGWTLVAEQDGAVVGVCQMEPPEDAAVGRRGGRESLDGVPRGAVRRPRLEGPAGRLPPRRRRAPARHRRRRSGGRAPPLRDQPACRRRSGRGRATARSSPVGPVGSGDTYQRLLISSLPDIEGAAMHVPPHDQLQAVVRDLTTTTRDGQEMRLLTAERHFPADRDEVWDALTNPERVPRWMAGRVRRPRASVAATRSRATPAARSWPVRRRRPSPSPGSSAVRSAGSTSR